MAACSHHTQIISNHFCSFKHLRFCLPRMPKQAPTGSCAVCSSHIIASMLLVKFALVSLGAALLLKEASQVTVSGNYSSLHYL